MEKIRTFFRQSYLIFKALYGFASPFAFILQKLFNPILQLSFFCLLDYYIYQERNVSEYVLGNAIILCSTSCIFGLGASLAHERYAGTLKILIISPSNHLLSFLQRSVIYIINSLITVVVSLAVGGVLFHADFTQVNLYEFALLLLVGVFSASCLGLLIASIGLVIDSLNSLLNIFTMLLLVFTGANYPLEKLPYLFRVLGNMLPLTRSILIGKYLLKGESIWMHRGLFLGEFGVGVVYVILGYVWMKGAERIAQVRGDLDLY